MNNFTTVITGTSKGIGKALAEYYIASGIRVIGCSRSESSICSDLYTHYTVDITDEIQVKNMVRNISQQHGQIHCLINNAGVASMNHILLTPYKTLHRLIDVNFIGTVHMTQHVAKNMLKYKYGRIINFSSVAVPLRLAGESVYSSSKAAIEQFTRTIAYELAPYITCNAIGPCPIKTDLIAGVDNKKIDQLIARQAIKRFAKYADIIGVVDFFKDSPMVTGQIIYLGGAN